MYIMPYSIEIHRGDGSIAETGFIDGKYEYIGERIVYELDGRYTVYTYPDFPTYKYADNRYISCQSYDACHKPISPISQYDGLMGLFNSAFRIGVLFDERECVSMEDRLLGPFRKVEENVVKRYYGEVLRMEAIIEGPHLEAKYYGRDATLVVTTCTARKTKSAGNAFSKM
jgi:hypothetical protein